MLEIYISDEWIRIGKENSQGYPIFRVFHKLMK